MWIKQKVFHKMALRALVKFCIFSWEGRKREMEISLENFKIRISLSYRAHRNTNLGNFMF